MGQENKAAHRHERMAAPPLAQASAQPANPLIYALAVTGAFFAVALFGVMHHEMWRDEHQAWLVARDAGSLAELFQNLKYEGNPGLWHLCLFIITRFTSNPLYMQAFHLLLACGFIFVFSRYCSLGIIQKLLFSFGYFAVYEYAVISRGYGLGLLLTFVVCALYLRRTSHDLLLLFVLGLLANVTLYGLIFSLGLAGTLCLDYFLHRNRAEKLSPAFVAGLGIYVVLALAALYQIIPDKNNSFPAHFAESWLDPRRWPYVCSRLFTTYFYVPNPCGIHFWNTNIFFAEPMKIEGPPDVWLWMILHPLMILVFVLMPAALFLLSVLVFLRKPLILLLYAGGTLALLAAYYYTLLVHMRYCGHLLILLVVCNWLSGCYADHTFRPGLLHWLANAGRRLETPLLTSILVVQVFGALVAYAKEYQFKFSVSREAADYIRQNGLDTLEFAGMTDFVLSPLASYFNKKIFYFQRLEFGSFTKWDKNRRDELTPRETYEALTLLLRQGRTKFLLITSEPIRISSDGKTFQPATHLLVAEDAKVDLLRTFDAGIVEDEKYSIYVVQKVDPTKEDLTGYTRLRFK